ncbi:MAG: hypothetical protein HN360_04790 [Rhodospirillaceae bacterium]|jgi:hypothetical protein|nr:hypothetical protein [Rhodospirillaceae bacterium]MBT4219405.1 hypothetical protein [Rhodospirillaceae bacterium]MBT5013000.1 hypothetical protein [Rhodospirillaceae bacterium]
MNIYKFIAFRNLRFLMMALVMVGLSACQTIKKVDTVDTRFASELISKSCVFGTGWEGDLITKHQMNRANNIPVRSISKGEEGWWRIGYIWSGNYWNYFINDNKKSIACGEEHFKTRGNRFKKIEGPLADDALVTALKGAGYGF